MDAGGTTALTEHPQTPDVGMPAGLPCDGVIVAIDWGEKRIGVAVSDPSQRIAHPVTTLIRRAGRRFPLKQLKRELDVLQPVGLVVGLPLDERGHEGKIARRVREEGRVVAVKTGLPTVYWDERMTTARVLGAMRDSGGSAGSRREPLDALAATVLLQGYLDSHRR